MKHIKQLMTFLFLVSLMLSCAPSAEKTNLKVSFGALTGSENFDGGLYVLIRSNETGQEILKLVPPSDEVLLELPNGSWQFSAVGWSGAGNFEGDIYCADNPNVQLLGGEFTVSLNATRAACASLGEPLDTSGNFPKVSFANCTNVKNFIDAGKQIPSDAKCGDTIVQGNAKSFKIMASQYNEQGAYEPGLQSACQTVNVTTGITNTNIGLPDGITFNHAKYVVRAFSNANCTGDIKEYVFGQGTQERSLADNTEGIVLKFNNRSTFLVDEVACVGDQLTNQPFALGSSSAGVYLICNEVQWNNIAKGAGSCPQETAGLPTMDCESNASYVLGADINFAGTNTTIPTNFDGNLKGNSYTVSNGNKALFSVIESPNQANERSRVSDLKINNFVIAEASAGYFGILANEIISNNPADTEGVEIDEVSINAGSSITNTAATGVGGIGAFAGKIDFSAATSNNDRFSLRKSQSYASVTSASSSADLATLDHTSIFATGGFFGIAIGKTSGSNISLEMNGLGVPVLDFMEDDGTFDPLNAVYPQIQISGHSHVGGAIGHLSDGEIRFTNMVKSDVKGKVGVGGLVGTAANYAQIQDSAAISNYIQHNTCSAIGDCEKIGGILGYSDTSLHIKRTISVFSVGDTANGYTAPSASLKFVGGVIGHYKYASNVAEIDNVKSVVNIAADGAGFGGIIGAHDTTPNGSPQVNIKKSVVHGGIVLLTPASADNYSRGGIAGVSNGGQYEMIIVDLVGLYGLKSLGGIAGTADWLNANEININIGTVTAAHTFSGVYVGGAIGLLNATGSSIINNIYIDTQIDIPVSNQTTCGGANCGHLIGSNNVAGMVLQFANIESPSIDINSSGASNLDDSFCSGSCTNGTHYNFAYQPATQAECSGLIADPQPWVWDGVNGVCHLLFESKWFDFAFDTGLAQYRAGNLLEPFIIAQAGDWNAIGQDALLLSKSYEVVGDIDFTSETVTPLGSDSSTTSSVFSGTIFGSGSLNNMTISTSGLFGGLINTCQDCSLGLREFPLKINNLDITCNSSLGCGTIAYGSNVKMFAHVSQADIRCLSNSPSSCGGLVGRLDGGWNEFQAALFEGSVNAPNATNVGGFIGEFESGATVTTRIEESKINLSLITGSTNVGGVVGNNSATDSAGNDEVKIEDTAVWISSGGTVAGFVGACSNQVNVQNSYVDILNSSITTFSNICGSASPNPSVSGVGVVASSGSPTYGESIVVSQTGLSGVGSIGEEDWAKDAQGRYVPWWEIEGFED